MNKFKRTGYALRNQRCHMGDRIYNFEQGKAYVITEEGDWAKFTGDQPVLRADGRAMEIIKEPPERVKYNPKTDKLRSKKK